MRQGLDKLSEHLTNRTEFLRDTIDAKQAEAMGAIDDLSTKMRERELKAQKPSTGRWRTFLARVLSIAVIFLG